VKGPSRLVEIEMSNPTVVIVGAGASGLSAARSLQDSGLVDVIILEARNRIGGNFIGI
jgi:cation diffusion facilitator CzcD-associated flavoprotein CzcO